MVFWQVHSAFESAVTFIVSVIQPKDDGLDYVRINVKTFGERLSLRNSFRTVFNSAQILNSDALIQFR
tara:strand:+ start:1203 stop:1406 length:204 start_codon:yes stop_codon:yes gene_type:complete